LAAPERSPARKVAITVAASTVREIFAGLSWIIEII